MKLKVTRKEAMPYLKELEDMAANLPKGLFGPLNLRKMCKKIRKVTNPGMYEWRISSSSPVNDQGQFIPIMNDETVVFLRIEKKYLIIEISPWVIRQARQLPQSFYAPLTKSCRDMIKKQIPCSLSSSIADMIYLIALTISIYDTNHIHLTHMQKAAKEVIAPTLRFPTDRLEALTMFKDQAPSSYHLLDTRTVLLNADNESVEIELYDEPGTVDGPKEGSVNVILRHDTISDTHLNKLNEMLNNREITVRMWGTRLGSTILAEVSNALTYVQYMDISSSIHVRVVGDENGGSQSVGEIIIAMKFNYWYPTTQILISEHGSKAVPKITGTVAAALSNLDTTDIDNDCAGDVLDHDITEDVNDIEEPNLVPESPNPTMPLTVKIERYDTETTRLCWNVAISMGPDFVEIPHAKSYDIKSQRNYFMRKMAVLKTKPDLSNNRHAPFIENLNTAVEKCTDFYPSFKVEFGRTTCVVDSDPNEGVLKSVQISFDIYVNIEERDDYTKYANKVIRNINRTIPNLKQMVVEALMPSRQS